MAAFAIGMTSIVTGATAADSREGKKLAERWCSACHFTNGAGQARDAAPPFSQMSDKRVYPEPRLRGWLNDPHPPMPDLALSRYDIDNIIAYIRTLNN